MRAIPFVFFAVSILLSGCLKTKAPEIVKMTFQQKYEGAEEVSWNEDRNDMYEAHFRLNGEKFRADFLPDGTWFETEQNVDWGELPDLVKDIFKRKEKCGKGDIIEIEKVDHFEKGVYYDIEYKKKGKKKDIGIRENGQIIEN